MSITSVAFQQPINQACHLKGGGPFVCLPSLAAEHRLIDEWLKLEAKQQNGWLRQILPN